MNYKFIRFGGLGDELCMTPMYREIKRQDPNAVIAVEGMYAEDILRNNPYVDARNMEIPNCKYIPVRWHNEIMWGYDMHLVDFYAKQCGITLSDRTIELYLDDRDKESVQFATAMARPLIAFNAYAGWQTKEFNIHGLIPVLMQRYPMATFIQVGKNPGYAGIGLDGTQTTSVRQMATILSHSNLYIGNDSGCYHVAAAMGTRCVIFFGSTDPACYIHNSEREVAIRSEVCYGCYNNKANAEIVKNVCPQGGYVCMNIDVEKAMEVIDRQILSSLADGGTDVTNQSPAT